MLTLMSNDNAIVLDDGIEILRVVSGRRDLSSMFDDSQ